MTLAEALNNAVARFDAAVALITGLRDQIALQLASTTANVQALINNFQGRPLYVNMYVDAINGSDANDGLSVDKPKKTVDAVLGGLNTQGIRILLLSDVTWRNRYVTTANIAFHGVQPANTIYKTAPARRTITFLGTAANSPSDTLGTMSAGLIADAGQIFTTEIDFMLPEVPSGVQLKPHFCSSLATFVTMINPTIRVATALASALLGSFNTGRVIATLSPTLGAGAAGHVFDGIAAGQNPNSTWLYSTNVTSA